jgi:hypothetical protein
LARASANRIGAGLAAGFDDLVGHQIRLGGRGGADGDRLIRQADMQGMPVGIGINRHRGDPHPAGGFDDADGNFAAIGNQYLAKQALPRRRGARA